MLPTQLSEVCRSRMQVDCSTQIPVLRTDALPVWTLRESGLQLERKSAQPVLGNSCFHRSRSFPVSPTCLSPDQTMLSAWVSLHHIHQSSTIEGLVLLLTPSLPCYPLQTRKVSHSWLMAPSMPPTNTGHTSTTSALLVSSWVPSSLLVQSYLWMPTETTSSPPT